MKEKTLNKIVNGICIAALTTSLFAGVKIVRNSIREGNVENKARTAAMRFYEPIYNGGSTQAFHGGVSENRREMYSKMQAEYERIMRAENLYDKDKDPYFAYAK